MAKTLAQGRKPGSGRKPGKGKTLREGRKPGSGRRRRQEDPEKASVRNKNQKPITSRDLEAVDALRELNNSPPQQQQLPQQSLAQQHQILAKDVQDPNMLPGMSLVAQNQLLSHPSQSNVPGAFTIHSVGPYMIPPQFMHTVSGVPSPLLVPLGANGSTAGSAVESSDAVFTSSRGSSGDDTTGSVLIHTST